MCGSYTGEFEMNSFQEMKAALEHRGWYVGWAIGYFQDDPYWDYIVEDYYDEDADTMPSIQHLYDALGITREEYVAATGDTGEDWPDEDRMDIIGQNGNNGEHYDNA